MLFLLIFLAVIAVGVGDDSWKAEVTYRYQQLKGNTTTVTIGDDTLPVEVATTAVDQAKGLSKRQRLRENTGMLFVFSTSDYWNFWMKDTLVSLDIIWIGNGKIVDIEDSVPIAVDENPPTYEPAQKANLVLEVAAGTTQSFGWHVGDEVTVKDIDKFTD